MRIETLAIEGTRFLINGELTYEGRAYDGHSLEGMLFNSRMVQAIFDDGCPDTVDRWQYPDTGVWDPERNTDEFCAMLPTYRAHGLLAVTVGMQGGGSIYTPDVYKNYLNTGFTPEGKIKEPYFRRLMKVIAAADACGMVVIVNYFYVEQVRRISDDDALRTVAATMTERLLESGYTNVVIDVANEAGQWWGRELFGPDGICTLIDIVKNTTLDGRRFLAGASLGGNAMPSEGLVKVSDFLLPHGNGCTPGMVKRLVNGIKEMPAYTARSQPIVINEDSTMVNNMLAALECGASWGFYCQGYGSGYRDPAQDWTVHGREKRYEDLSGFQTVPVNWGINTIRKRAFFNALKEITGA